MIKLITYINFAAFLVGAIGLGGAFIYRSKILDVVLNNVKKEIPSLINESLQGMPKIPNRTGPALPFK